MVWHVPEEEVYRYTHDGSTDVGQGHSLTDLSLLCRVCATLYQKLRLGLSTSPLASFFELVLFRTCAKKSKIRAVTSQSLITAR